MYSDSVGGTYRKGSYTEDTERHVTEGSGNEVFIFYRSSIMVTQIT